MKNQISRRGALGAPFLLAGCLSAKPYFGRTVPPDSQRLVYANGEEPSSLDPAQLVGGKGDNIVAAMVESLTALHPLTYEPMAGLATHYEAERQDTRYTFYLRGHPSPRGQTFQNTNALPVEFSRGRPAPPDALPGLWSDGTPVTAHDFVYSWRRLADPATAAPMGFYLGPVVNAEQIAKGRKVPETLGVSALDDFTFQVELETSSPSFSKMLWQPFLAAVPRHAVEAARRSGAESQWTAPGRYLSNGTFRLHEWRPHDRVVVRKNERYWDAGAVSLAEIVFLSTASGATIMSLYRAGTIQSMDVRQVPPLFVSALQGKRDFHTGTAYRSTWYAIDVRKPPLDRLRVRYALSLATDRRAIASFLGAGRAPACGLVPPIPGYPAIKELFVSINGQRLNIVGFDPRAGRSLLASEGLLGMPLSLAFPSRTGSRDIAPIIQSQWREHLGISLTLTELEETAWEQSVIRGEYRQTIEDSWTAYYEDPYDFLLAYGPPHYVATTWTDPHFNSALAAANSMVEPDRRMHALAGCEEQLLNAMPIIPLFFDGWAYFEAPYLHGMRPNPFGCPRFKYAWIDTNWRPS